MSLNEILKEIMHLPEEDFVQVADAVREREEDMIMAEAARRAEELRSGKVKPLTHEEVFVNLRERYKRLSQTGS